MRTIQGVLVLLVLLPAIACNSSMPGATGSSGSGGSPNPPPPIGSTSITLVSLSPDSVPAGSADFPITLTVKGLPATPNLTDHPAVYWQPQAGQTGVYLGLTDGDDTHLTATVPTSLVQSSGTFGVQVQIFHHADDMPKAVSNLMNFRVTN